MEALTTLFPVFFMLALGFVCRKKGWITPNQKAGANAIIFNILFPVLIFSILVTTHIEMEYIFIVLYVFVMYSIGIVIGKLTSGFTGKQFAHFSPYLLSCIEGGSVALPLYMSVVGQSSNTVIYDLAGTLMAFIVIPVMVARATNQGDSKAELVKNIFNNTFVIAVLLGLVLNLTGIYETIMQSSFGPMVQGTLNQVTSPIIAMILFMLGFDLNIDASILKPVIKLMIVKTVYFALVIAGFFVLFPSYMADPIYRIAPMLYFMSPTGFGLIPIIEPLYKKEEDSVFASAFLSIYILVTLVVYTVIVVFTA